MVFLVILFCLKRYFCFKEIKPSTITVDKVELDLVNNLLIIHQQFEVEQQKHRATMQNKLVQLHEEIIAIMKNTYEVFKNDGTDVSTKSLTNYFITSY